MTHVPLRAKLKAHMVRKVTLAFLKTMDPYCGVELTERVCVSPVSSVYLIFRQYKTVMCPQRILVIITLQTKLKVVDTRKQADCSWFLSRNLDQTATFFLLIRIAFIQFYIHFVIIDKQRNIVLL